MWCTLMCLRMSRLLVQQASLEDSKLPHLVSHPRGTAPTYTRGLWRKIDINPITVQSSNIIQLYYSNDRRDHLVRLLIEEIGFWPHNWCHLDRIENPDVTSKVCYLKAPVSPPEWCLKQSHWCSWCFDLPGSEMFCLEPDHPVLVRESRKREMIL